MNIIFILSLILIEYNYLNFKFVMKTSDTHKPVHVGAREQD